MINGIIGVRYARNCHPDDLWSKYFTSSRFVKKFREEHGEPDVIEVRQTFNDSLQAREWEEKVLKRLKVLKSEKWLNKNIGGLKFSIEKHSEETKQKMRKPKSSTINMRKPKSSTINMRKPKSEETKKSMKNSFTDERRQQISEHIQNLIWITNGILNKRILNTEEISEGWWKGRPESSTKGKRRTEETKEKIRKKRKEQIMSKGWIWITNGSINKKWNHNEMIPNNFKRGLTHGKSTSFKRE